MIYNFDEIINRKNTNSIKHDFAVMRGKPEDAIPLWVADMDFKAPAEVEKALKRSAEHGVFGYTDTKDDYFCAVTNWFKKGFDFDVKQEWLVKTPGVVYAIAMAIRAFTEKGDAVMIQNPVYYPFSHTIRNNDRVLINNALVYSDGKYSIDFGDFERKIIENKVKMFILCSPHNPVGRVWTTDELRAMGDICKKHHCIVISDEIHCDFVYEGYRHNMFTTVSPDFWDNSIICTAPSKTFNLAGLQISNIFIANAELRKLFINEIYKSGYSQLNIMGLTACQAAYEYGGDWLCQLKSYLANNVAYIRDFLRDEMPEIKLVEPQGTYLVWLDFKSLGLSQPELDDLILNRAKLWLDTGTMFGDEGTGFQRINTACPKSVIEKAMRQLREAVGNRN